MIIQILKEYSPRTEYKVLEKYAMVQEKNIDEISQGILLLPGILLTRLNENELQKLRDWLKAPNNQLIITPALTEYNLRDFFDISIDLLLLKEEVDYEGIQCDYRIEGRVQNKIFTSEKGDFGIHYRKDTGSGLITIITLPLLDYKLSHKHDKFKEYFNVCIREETLKKETQEIHQSTNIIQEDHIQVLMLIAAGYILGEEMAERFNQYFNKKLDNNFLKAIEAELEEKSLINQGQVTSKGKELINERRLNPFVKVLEGGRRKDGW